MKFIGKQIFYKVFGFVSGFLILAFLANAIISKYSFPETGKWTGIWPLEQKMKLLEQFAKEGPVDALFLGNSISEAGFNAEEFSRLMTKYLGRPYRAFNFSTGSGEISIYPALYRIARTVAKPKIIYALTPIESNRGNTIYPDTPEYFLNHSPARLFLSSEKLLEFSRWVWNIPLIKNATLFRDLIIEGNINVRMEGADTTYISSFGDRIGFYIGSKKTMNEIFYHLRPKEERKFKRPQGPVTSEYYFPQIDIDAMDELVKLASEDGTKIELLNHVASTLSLYPPDRNEEYLFCREQYIQVMASRYGLKAHSFLDSFWIAPYQLMDTSHLNYFGSIYYTRRLYIEMTGDSVENHLVKLEANLQQIPDDYIESFTQVIVREKIHQGTKLQLKLMSSRFGLPKFTQSELWVSLMTHDQREIIAPVEIGKDNLKAVFTDFPNGPDQAMIMKVLEKVNGKYYSVYAPIRGYEWSN